MHDELGATVDYEAVSKEVKALAAARPRQLLETLAAELVTALLKHTQVAEVEVELRKRVLPGVKYAAVRMRRAKGRG
jgi:dihydroneopterin aldolase